MDSKSQHQQFGPVTLRLLQRSVAAVFSIAWLSLGSQVQVLIGSRGLLPIAPFLDLLATRTAPDGQAFGFAEFPTFLWLNASDGALTAGWIIGLGLTACAFVGWYPRLSFALSAFLYLGYTVAGRDFYSFQWDNLLIESAVLLALIPSHGRARWGELLLKLLLFKLYFESGGAKFQSPIKDWHDGSAMTFYYETAPLPTALAWYAHHLPKWWHHFESRATLVWELGVPILIFFGRRLRLIAFGVFAAFQVINAATANYGFFCYLALALGVVLLDDSVITTWSAKLAVALGSLRRRWPSIRRVQARMRLLRRRTRTFGRALWKPPSLDGTRLAGAVAGFVCMVYITTSSVQAYTRFVDRKVELGVLGSLSTQLGAWRIVNSYHLFRSITRVRDEVELQTFDGAAWTAHDLRYKPGNPTRRPPFVAPHQPRVDFRLWFFPLGRWVDDRVPQADMKIRGMPRYLRTLLTRMCEDPTAVDELFDEPLPARPEAVRIVLWRTRFATPEARSADGAYWQRWEYARTRPFACHHTR